MSPPPRILRRTALGLGLGAVGYAALRMFSASEPSLAALPASALDRGNFERIYADVQLKARFRLFLQNVFHLYPEQELHDFIARAVTSSPRDPQVYQAVANGLPGMSPALASLRFALPALFKQKGVMRAQTVQLLGARRKFNGYLELGSHGRYLSALRDALEIDGPIYTSAIKPPNYGLEDVVDREQIGFLGEVVPWTSYEPLHLPKGSLQLVTVYIGFHHARIEQREDFIASIRQAMAPGAKLILRDHDVTNEGMQHLVGLAHDVFNVGTHEPWAVNEHELRNFYPLQFIVDYLSARGFKPDAGRLLQDGDPTLNTLLSFTKV